MEPKIKELIDLAKKMEMETLEKGDSVMMKVFAVTKDGQTTVIAFADYTPEKRNELMMGLGLKLRETMGDKLETLMLVSDAYMVKGDVDTRKMSPAEQIIFNDVTTGKRRLEDLPPELHKFRSEGLIFVVSENQGKKVGLVSVPHSLEKGKVVWGKEWDSPTQTEDHMLSNIWKGYNYAQKVS